MMRYITALLPYQRRRAPDTPTYCEVRHEIPNQPDGAGTFRGVSVPGLVDGGAGQTRTGERHHQAGGGKCIVFSTHIMQEVERLCDQVVVIAHGRTVAIGSVAQLNAAGGHADFEETFVDLAFGADERPQTLATRGAA